MLQKITLDALQMHYKVAYDLPIERTRTKMLLMSKLNEQLRAVVSITIMLTIKITEQLRYQLSFIFATLPFKEATPMHLFTVNRISL